MKKQLCTVLTLFTTILSAQVNLTSSLSACYTLDGHANDYAGVLNGTMSAVTATVDRYNAPNSALQFNGTAGSFIELPDSPLLKPANGLSFSIWIKFKAITSADHILFTRNLNTGQFAAYNLCLANIGGGKSVFRTYMENTSGSLFAQSTTTIALNTWYHVSFSQDMTSLKIYVNGVLEDTKANTLTKYDYVVGKTVILGGTNETSYNTPFTGTLDNVRFYTRTLNAAEMSDLYFNPDCDAISTSITKNQLSSGNARIVPNPNNGDFKLNFDNSEKAKLLIIDALGKVVVEKEIYSGEEISMNTLATGVYTAKLTNAVSATTLKFIKN